jgi:uncharacterized membrane protein YkvA (DUF1232 family)
MENKKERTDIKHEDRHMAYIRIRSYVGLFSTFLGLLINLLRDSRVCSADKAILGATVAYMLNPVDLMPDWVPFTGLVDDIYLVALAIMRLILRVDEKVLKDNWKGPDDIIFLVKKFTNVATAFLPFRIRRSILEKVDR